MRGKDRQWWCRWLWQDAAICVHGRHENPGNCDRHHSISQKDGARAAAAVMQALTANWG